MANKMVEMELVTFKLGDEEYGINISLVREIIKFINITPVPKAPPFVKGLINLRGSIVPVIDLRKRFNMKSYDNKDDNRIIIVKVDNNTIGIIVDCVFEVIKLDRNNLEPIPPTLSAIETKYLDGVYKLNDRLILIIKLDRMLNSDELMEAGAIN